MARFDFPTTTIRRFGRTFTVLAKADGSARQYANCSQANGAAEALRAIGVEASVTLARPFCVVVRGA